MMAMPAKKDAKTASKKSESTVKEPQKYVEKTAIESVETVRGDEFDVPNMLQTGATEQSQEGSTNQNNSDTSKVTKKQEHTEKKSTEFGRMGTIIRSAWFRWTAISLGVLLLILLVLGVTGYLVLSPLVKEAEALKTDGMVHAASLQQGIKDKNLVVVNAELENLRQDVTRYENLLDKVGWMAKIPGARPYFEDAQHVGNGATSMLAAAQTGVDAVTPYADLLGLKISDQPVEDPETTQDRIEFVVTTLDKISPQLEDIAGHLEQANAEFQQIDPNRYPEQVGDVMVRQQLATVINTIDQTTVLLTDARPLLDVAPYILGIDEPRQYLMMFQNDAEMRATGGFMTAYAILEVNKGKFTPVYSSDIYDLDAKYTGRTTAPKPLIDYIEDPYNKEARAGQNPRWRLRDMNMSPDYRVSMEQFAEAYEQIPGARQVDGYMAIDTKVLVALLEVTGAVGVPGYGEFSDEIVPECNCPKVIYELESAISYETPYFRENRKAIIGPLMHTVLLHAMGQPKEKMADLVEMGIQSIKQKNVLMYFPDEEIQTAVESFNLAGRVRDVEGDYLMVVDSNFGGAKSNLYIEQEIDVKVEPTDNGSRNTVSIKYKNPQRNDGWLNGDSPDYLRVYVPKGSTLVDSSGSELEVTTIEDLDKTVFEAFFVLRPQGTATLSFTYDTPVQQSGDYRLTIQKQGGAKNHETTVDVAGQKEEFDLDGDREMVFAI